MNKTLVSACGFITLMLTAAVWGAPVPDSGQTKCYNNTVEILCPSPGQPFYGQAANYDINLLSYTKLDSIGKTLPNSAAEWSMVRDNVTGLIWENKTEDGTIHDKKNTYVWYDPTNPNPGTPRSGMDTQYFIDFLNNARFGGFADWRMPTVKELGTLISYNIPGQNVDINYFPNTNMSQMSYYWSSTSYAGHTGYAWSVDFGYGHDDYHGKYNSKYVRAVRGGQAESSTAADAYVDNGDGTVTDTSTGLMWQQAGPSNEMNWEQALAYCEELNLGGYTDWRMPAKKALRSLVDFSRVDPAINTTYFPDTIMSFYWSSTTNVYLTDYAWGAYFYVGYDSFSNKRSYGFVRAVRGGQAPTPTGCTATIDENFLLKIPYLSYVNPLLGTISLWADFVYEFNPTYPLLILFRFTNAGILDNPSYLCATSTLTNDLKIHIPDVLLPDGSTHYWLDLEYGWDLSSAENTYFFVTNLGIVSN